jgi:hypothetical protein
MKEFTKAPEPPKPDPAEVEDGEPTPTVMALAFQAAIQNDAEEKNQRDIDKLISNSLKR